MPFMQAAHHKADNDFNVDEVLQEMESKPAAPQVGLAY
jgi:hypothetical protein